MRALCSAGGVGEQVAASPMTAQTRQTPKPSDRWIGVGRAATSCRVNSRLGVLCVGTSHYWAIGTFDMENVRGVSFVVTGSSVVLGNFETGIWSNSPRFSETMLRSPIMNLETRIVNT